MNTFAYLRLIIKEELLAVRELLIEQRWLIIILVVLLGALIYYLNPFPPRSIAIAVGDQNGAYWKTAENFSRYFRDNGVDLLVEASGSLENAELLAKNDQNVRIAFLQGGSLDPKESSRFYSLGSIAHEPLWIFYQKNLPKNPSSFEDLSHLRVGVVPKLGGTQKLFHEVMQLNGIDSTKLPNLVLGSYPENLQAFLDGKLDALVKVAAYHDQAVQSLLRDSNTQLLSIPDACSDPLPFCFSPSAASFLRMLTQRLRLVQQPSITMTTAFLLECDIFHSGWLVL